VPLVDFGEPVVVTPGLVDAHVHLSQAAIRGRSPGPLLEWLERVVFPEEACYADPSHAARGVESFERALLGLGTTAAGVYVTVHTEATRVALDRLRVRGPVGKVLMDRNAPPDLLQEASVAIDELGELIDRFGDRAAVVPRFAVSCSDALLAAAGRLAASRAAIVMT
jgi:guanine deaminase